MWGELLQLTDMNTAVPVRQQCSHQDFKCCWPVGKITIKGFKLFTSFFYDNFGKCCYWNQVNSAVGHFTVEQFDVRKYNHDLQLNTKNGVCLYQQSRQVLICVKRNH